MNVHRVGHLKLLHPLMYLQLSSLRSWIIGPLLEAEPLRALVAILLLDARLIAEWSSGWLKDVLSSQPARTALVQFVIRNPGFRLYN